MSPEVKEALAEQGIEFSDWQPTIPEKHYKFLITGADGSGKSDLVRKLLGSLNMAWQSESFIYHGDLAVGMMADYRVELKLATDRIFIERRNADPEWATKPFLYTHSLLDSLAYATLAVQLRIEHRGTSLYAVDKAAVVMAVIGAMFRDSFRFDHVFLIQRDLEGEAAAVQERMKLILDEFEIQYTLLEEKDEQSWHKTAVDKIREMVDGSRNTSDEPS